MTAMVMTATAVSAQNVVISEKTAVKIESIKAKAAKDAENADKKMQQDDVQVADLAIASYLRSPKSKSTNVSAAPSTTSNQLTIN